ncbi:MAG TPA: ABC transporter ATP-binding protein [Fimbriimonadaceae bacterium]|nr:ABC transporter ATP-binding protein [Fimbriimonadaceae bacterium]
MPLLTTHQLTCGYPGREVLAGVDLSIEPGTSTVLLGPNGSGKSTLLKTLVKTLPLLNGRVQVGDRDLSSLSFAELATQMAYVPQEEVPPFRFTVRQVVLMGRMPISDGFFDTPADHQAAESAMREADCFDLADRPVNEISGGERQRALIARALAQDAPMLLLDEPTSHLDIGHQVAIVELVRRLRGQGKATLAAMHDLNLAADLGEQALLLRDGKIAMAGPVEAVLESPELDQTYGVPFHRFRDGTGRLRVFAASPATVP